MSARKFLMNKTWDGRPSVASPYKISFVINATTGDIVLQIDAPYFNDPPPPGEPGKYLKVYDYEVVEVFIAAYPNDDDAASAQYSPYLEVQIGPHGHYNLVFFLQEGDFANMDTSIELDRPPSAKINPKTGRWTAEVAIPSFFLPEPVCGDDLSITWMMNAYAMHGQGEQREHIAYSPVPGAKPNFHQLRYFCPLVLFETLETRMTIDRTNSMASEKIRQSSMAGYMTAGGGGGLGAAMGLAAGAGGGGGDLSNRLMADVMKSGGMKGAYAEDDEDDTSSVEENGSTPSGSGTIFKMGGAKDAGKAAAPPDATDLHEGVAKQIKGMGLQLEELEEKFARHLQPSVKLLQKSQGEYSVLHALVSKRKGLSIKSRMLILTNKSRLMYFDMQGTYKGSVPWSVTKPVSTVLVSPKKFQVIVHDKSRKYHFTDPQGAERWITAINLFITAQRSYLKNTMAK